MPGTSPTTPEALDAADARRRTVARGRQEIDVLLRATAVDPVARWCVIKDDYGAASFSLTAVAGFEPNGSIPNSVRLPERGEEIAGFYIASSVRARAPVSYVLPGMSLEEARSFAAAVVGHQASGGTLFTAIEIELKRRKEQSGHNAVCAFGPGPHGF